MFKKWQRPHIRRWKQARLLRILFALIFILLGLTLYQPQTASAHPLGNFSVNRYSRLEPDTESISLLYVVDMAEIPAFQEQALIDRDLNGRITETERQNYLADQLAALQSNLTLIMNGETARLLPQSQNLTFPPGQGGLDTLRLELTFLIPLPVQSEQLDITYRDTNYLERAGWQEIVVRPTDAITLLSSSVPAESLSQELREYPEYYLNEPVKVQEATFQFRPVATAGQPSSNTIAAAITAEDANLFAEEQLAGLINIPEGPGPLLVAVVLAFILGALHALSPGHGKTIVGAYLVGSRGTARHALFLGITTTLTHTAGVFAFGFLVLFASQFILPERLYPWLGVMSGLLVVGIGFSLFRGRLAGLRHAYAHLRGHEHDHLHHSHTIGHIHDHSHRHDPSHGHDHGYSHDHDQSRDHGPDQGGHHSHEGHDHSHGPHDHHHHHHGPGRHSHVPQEDENGRITWRSLLALGISGGLLPCPSALVLLLSAIALQRVGLGLFLILIFSTGLAGVLTAVGLMFVYAGRMLERAPKSRQFGRLAPLLPVFSALFVTIAGAAITTQAILQTGILS